MNSAEIQRILNLPCERTVEDLGESPALFKQDLRTLTGEMSLFDVQRKALLSAYRHGGLLGSIGVGHGKTLISLLLPRVMSRSDRWRPIECALLVVPASRLEETIEAAQKLRDHWRIPARRIELTTYGMLSTDHTLLDDVQPDLIICDECHKLRHRSSARTKRVLRYFRDSPDTRFCGFSGTLLSEGIEDLAHLAELALRDLTPLPRTWSELSAWSRCLDESHRSYPQLDDWRQMQPLVDAFFSGQDLTSSELNTARRRTICRKAFFERFASAPGIVFTRQSSCQKPIKAFPYKNVSVPPDVVEALESLYTRWETPDGRPLDLAMHKTAYEQQILTGFYYRTIWPTESGAPDPQWLDIRSKFHGAVRDYCRRSIVGRDSPGLVIDALENGENLPSRIERLHHMWSTMKERCSALRRETVWLSDYWLERAVRWALPRRAIIWYRHVAVADRIEDHFCQVDVIRPDDPSPEQIPNPPRCVALSIPSHGVGANLQAWQNQIVVAPPISPLIWEQMLGRTHRTGQDYDHLTLAFPYFHSSQQDRMKKSMKKSIAIEQQIGQEQKLASYVSYVETDLRSN